jgi:hypothetical protein
MKWLNIHKGRILYQSLVPGDDRSRNWSLHFHAPIAPSKCKKLVTLLNLRSDRGQLYRLHRPKNGLHQVISANDHMPEQDSSPTMVRVKIGPGNQAKAFVLNLFIDLGIKPAANAGTHHVEHGGQHADGRS